MELLRRGEQNRRAFQLYCELSLAAERLRRRRQFVTIPLLAEEIRKNRLSIYIFLEAYPHTKNLLDIKGYHTIGDVRGIILDALQRAWEGDTSLSLSRLASEAGMNYKTLEGWLVRYPCLRKTIQDEIKLRERAVVEGRSVSSRR